MTALTFDVDFTAYATPGADALDEIDAAFPVLRELLETAPHVVGTWFVRVDSQIAAVYGAHDFILRRHAPVFEWLRERGHEIAWHHHAYEYNGGKWRPCIDEAAVVTQIRSAGEIARAHGVSVCRMGWGFQTNATMQALEDGGWVVDSSAIPRPSYAWDAVPRDWSVTPQTPYFPAQTDYRRAGIPSRRILEIPITTVALPVPGDDHANVIRYLNLAYRPDLFRAALERVPSGVEPVLVSHPYEILPSARPHVILSFDARSWQQNLETLSARSERFTTMSAMAAGPVAHTLTRV